MSVGTRVLALCAVAGALCCVVGLLLDPKAMLAGYFAVWIAFTAIPVGAIGVMLLSYLVRGGWTQDMHVPLSRVMLLLPVAALAFVPVLIGLKQLYPWATDASDLPAFKAIYLTPWFFILRTIVYFAIWILLGLAATRAYGDDATMQRVGSYGLIVWALTASFAGIDWVESTEPAFHSSTYGLLILSFDLMAAFCFALAVILARAQPRQMANTAYGGVLLSTILLWTYLHAMQYIIIWSGNIPDEVVWYLRRSSGAWGVLLWLLALGQFVVPFFLLLSERMRASTRVLLWIALASTAARLVEAALLILPPLDVAPLAAAACVIAALLLLGAIALIAWRASEPQRWPLLRRAAPG